MKQFIAAAAFGAAIFGTAAQAAEGKVPQTSVNIADLDLSTEAGVAELDARIDRAARNICEIHQSRTGTILVPRDSINCYNAAKKSVKSQVALHIKNARLGG